MDSKQLIGYMTQPERLKDEAISDVEQLVADYPYFAIGQTLLAVAYQNADDDRYDAMKAAADNGAKFIVCAGFMQGNALAKAAAEFTDVNFIFIDGWAFDGLDNIAGIAFKEEQCGYLAGYATVKEGFTKLGFCGGGGGTNPACCRYGYGFVQGASAAAADMGVNVEVNYSWLYGSSFSSSPALQTLANGWYETGTEAIFACGGSMFSSIAAAASANDGAVIGVDVDQAATIDGLYGEGMTVTSAMKGLAATVKTMLAAVSDGAFEGGKVENLGLVSEVPEENYVQLAGSTQFGDGFTEDDYIELVGDMLSGAVTVSNDTDAAASDFASVITVVDQGNIK